MGFSFDGKVLKLGMDDAVKGNNEVTVLADTRGIGWGE